MPKRVHVRDYGFEATATYRYCGRPSPFGNPFIVSRRRSRAQCVKLFERWGRIKPGFVERVKRELRGLDLGCHCGPKQRCHVDVVLRWANEP